MDDNLIVGLLQLVKDKGKKLAKEIEIEDVSKLKEFVGCKIKIDKSEWLTKFTNLSRFSHSWMNLVQEKRSK